MKKTHSHFLSCLRQFVTSFLSLFGYKREGRFVKYVWRTFAASAAVIMFVLAGATVYDVYRQIRLQKYYDRSMALYGERISHNIYFSDEDGDGFVVNTETGKKLLKHVAWVAKPLGGDSLVCYSDGKLRGYFRKSDGKVIIPPCYEHAWVFSDGLAAVEEGGKIKFIDSSGNVVIDNGMEWDGRTDGYVFHGGNLIVHSKEGKYGLMDRNGKLVIPMEQDYIGVSNNHKYWSVVKGDESTVLDEHLDTVLPFTEGCYSFVRDEAIELTKPDNTVSAYDFEGNLLNDFCISSTRHLEYETDEIVYKGDTYTDDDGNSTHYFSEEHKKATARLRAYVAAHCYEGLMTADGRIVTMPLYKNIEAIGPDTYLCEVSDGNNIVVNGRGEIIR